VICVVPAPIPVATPLLSIAATLGALWDRRHFSSFASLCFGRELHCGITAHHGTVAVVASARRRPGSGRFSVEPVSLCVAVKNLIPARTGYSMGDAGRNCSYHVAAFSTVFAHSMFPH
jgi:hypothetical protein